MSVLEMEVAARCAANDRRRPGRLPHVSPELIPLLRGEAAPVPEQPIEFGEPDQLRSARGVILAVMISAALWAGIACTGVWLLS